MRFATPFVFALSVLVVTLPAPVGAASMSLVQAQTQGAGALERGYRTGYSDGFQAGFKDVQDGVTKDHVGHEEYRDANRAYAPAYGSLEEYQDGYRQGFQIGYSAGYERRDFDSSIPVGLSANGGNIDTESAPGYSNATSIPARALLRIELLNDLTTDVSQQGDKFRAKVIEPSDLKDAIVEGHISRLRRAGKVKGTAELQLAFDRITTTDNRVVPFRAQVVEVITPDLAGVGDVDTEGGIRGKDSTRDEVKKVGAGSAIGAVIGAIAGGGKGAAIGAAVGGGAVTGGVLATRGNELRLQRGQQLRIQTATQTQLQ